jgi:hypothetical protein
MKRLFPNAAAVLLAVAMPAYAQTSNTKPAAKGALSAAEAKAFVEYGWVLIIAGLGGILGVLFSVPLRRGALRHGPWQPPAGEQKTHADRPAQRAFAQATEYEQRQRSAQVAAPPQTCNTFRRSLVLLASLSRRVTSRTSPGPRAARARARAFLSLTALLVFSAKTCSAPAARRPVS